ncbi:hypothetical protein GQ607_015180 [Colletotrichum asianum]|uniref:Uncharacterized protein n=1 Tax=Colletotrichum asianum TaxID=702518 RepID=A0A8H3ZFD0_9PEZI|nr:hypothetical protein GQ607_015180 [Colletotrichum asianum]
MESSSWWTDVAKSRQPVAFILVWSGQNRTKARLRKVRQASFVSSFPVSSVSSLCPTRRTPSALLSSISILEGWGSCHSCLAGVLLTRASKPRTSAGLFSRL